MTTVHQLVPSVVPGDATTAHTLQVQGVLRDLGFESEIYATAVHHALEGRVRLLHELRGPSRRDGFLLYQLSAHSPLADWLIGRLEAVGVNYHNVTPSSFFRRWDRGATLAQRAAEVQVAQLGRVASIGVCDSAFNARDLHAKGWAPTATPVAPVLVDLASFDTEPDPATAAALARRDGAGHGTRWLFVGALAPHKAQHHLVRALALYRRVYDPAARLTLVGRPVVPAYDQAVRRYVAALGLEGAVELTGPVDHAQLVAHYQAADVLVSASAHEGFCVPLLEALHHGLPVVALAAGAVPATLGGAGVLVDTPAAPVLAAAVARVWADHDLRAALGRVARQRLDALSLERTRRRMADVLGRWVASGGQWHAPEGAGAGSGDGDVGGALDGIVDETATAADGVVTGSAARPRRGARA